jgi:hypothetical protein
VDERDLSEIDFRHLKAHAEFVGQLCERGCEHGRTTRKALDDFKQGLHSELEAIQTVQTVLRDETLPQVFKKVEEAVKMAIKSVEQTSQAITAVNRSSDMVNSAHKAVQELKDKYNHLGWDLLLKFGGLNLLILSGVVALRHYKLL